MVNSDQACLDEALQYFTLHYSVRLVGFSRNMGLDVNFFNPYQNTHNVEHQASDPIRLEKETQSNI